MVEVCVPNPEHLIKSIAEQGYTLESSIADLVDNSISAGAKNIEILVNTQLSPFQLFIADDGRGMSSSELKKNMEFPSRSSESVRDASDLGRFGLGLKTASFAQARSFTVLSRQSKKERYNARTWDVSHLKESGRWEIIINSDDEIDVMLSKYEALSQGFLNPFNSYSPNTIIVWHGLYKFENGINQVEDSSALQKELTETAKEHLQLIFHRFMEEPEPLTIRLNNEHLVPFNPFPSRARQISPTKKALLGDKLKLEGYVLPNISLEESKGISEWTLTHKSLMDMEGMYIYRANRIIVFSGWNGVIKKSPRLQLARLKVEIGNGIDHLFHLNVAKSSIIIPFGERIGFMRYVSELKAEAEKEFFNFETRAKAIKSQVNSVFKKVPTNHGMSLAIDENFSLLKSLTATLNEDQKQQLKIILKMVTTAVNKIKKVHNDESYTVLNEKEGINEEDVKKMIEILMQSGVSKENILNEIIPTMGVDRKSLPQSILILLQ